MSSSFSSNERPERFGSINSVLATPTKGSTVDQNTEKTSQISLPPPTRSTHDLSTKQQQPLVSGVPVKIQRAFPSGISTPKSNETSTSARAEQQ